MPRRYTVEGVGARREQLFLGAVAAAVLVAIVAFAAAGGGVRTDTTPPRPTPAPTPAAERELFGGSLEPGVRYRTRAFVPALSFKVADTEWLVRDATQPNVLTLDRRDRTARPGSELPPRAFLTFSRITDVYDPRTGRLTAAPADLYTWMRRHPDLRVSARESVTVAGVPGERFRIAVRFEKPAVDAPDCRRLLFTCTAIAPNHLFRDGTRMRTIVLATEPDPLVIDLTGVTARALDAVEGAAVPVLRSLLIGVR
jgi:hypothetical protein